MPGRRRRPGRFPRRVRKQFRLFLTRARRTIRTQPQPTLTTVLSLAATLEATLERLPSARDALPYLPFVNTASAASDAGDNTENVPSIENELDAVTHEILNDSLKISCTTCVSVKGLWLMYLSQFFL